MHRTVRTWDEFRAHWAAPVNFLMADACVPFAFPMPDIASVVAELRDHPETGITSGVRGRSLDQTNIATAFRAKPLEQALREPFAMSHFHLSVFDVPGGFLHGFRDQVLDPWQAALTAAGYTWDRCYPIIFISGVGCATNYHMDLSHVVAWQIHGTKRFAGLRDPDRWAPEDVRVSYSPSAFQRPAALTDADALVYDMPPGTVLWNALLTPHWVEAGSEVAMSVNLSHGGLRLHGELCPHEAQLMAHRAAQGRSGPPVSATY